MNRIKFKSISYILASFLLVAPLGGCLFGNNVEPVEDTGVETSVEDTSEKPASEELSEKDNDEAGEDKEDEGKYITVDYTCFSEKKDELKLNIPSEIKRDGKTYEYTGQSEYVVSETMECVEFSTELQVEDIEDAEDTITYKSPRTGKIYVLSANTFNWSDLTKIKKKVTEKVEFSGYVNKPDMPATKTLTYLNKETNEEETCEGKLEDWGASGEYWAKAEEPITGTFERDASDYYAYGTDIWENDVEWKIRVDIDNNYPSWDGWEKDVLKIARVPADEMDNYRLIGADWASEKYYAVVQDKDGKDLVVERRDAEYPFEMKVQDYWGEYVGYGESIGYKSFVTYYATVEEVLEALKKKDKSITKDDIKDDIKVIYKMKATATFKEKE